MPPSRRSRARTWPLFTSMALLWLGPTTASAGDAEGEGDVLARIAALREAEELPELQRHPELDEAARVHSEDMARRGELSHLSPETGNPADRVRSTGLQVPALAENIASGKDARAAHRSVVESQPHREQLLDERMTHIGLAIVRGEDGERVWMTQVLARVEPPPEPELDAPWSEQTEHGAATQDQVDEGESEQQPAPDGRDAPPSTGEADTRAMEPRTPPEAVPPSPKQPPREDAPRVSRTRDNQPVAGYWVYWSGRWWYYPMPEDAQPGQVLQPEPGVHGPPPGYAHEPHSTRQRVRVRVRHHPPTYRWSHLRRGQRYYWRFHPRH